MEIYSCPARLRTRLDNDEAYATHNYHDASQKVEVVCDEHNHDIITERRKRGSLKMLKQKKAHRDAPSDSEQVEVI